MRARKNVAKQLAEDIRYLTLLRQNYVNSMCDVINLDQIRPISVHDI